jgi:hypothetical protein
MKEKARFIRRQVYLSASFFFDYKSEFIYTVSLLPEGLTKERVGVLPIVRYGGRYWARTSDL